MPNINPNSLKFRPLLTETLPYEVPIIFSNAIFYNSLRERISDENLARALGKMRPVAPLFTKPYSYLIRKAEDRKTTLSIIHPLHQMNICDFYDNHHASLIFSCAKSSFSLRRPTGVSKKHAAKILKADDEVFKSGIVDINRPPTEADAPIIGSYFVYENYNLLSRFIDSREFIRMEKKFTYVRSMDISRCFFNIYTHSISWAVKSKEVAKSHTAAYSFENAFDKLMQQANYNETNGIVVGPEISRVFAEIILQQIDLCVKESLSADGLQEETDYAIRRYVDDYYVFSNTTRDLDKIESRIREHLETVKLFINEEKVSTASRPFVSSISMARREIKGEFQKLNSLLREVQVGVADSGSLRWKASAIRADIGEIRLVVAKHGVRFHAVSGWLLGAIRNAVLRLDEDAQKWQAIGLEDEFSEILVALLELVFYICYLDIRVRPTYSLGQILQVVYRKILPSLKVHNRDLIQHSVTEELIGIVRRVSSLSEDQGGDNIELFNLLICGALFVGEYFLDNKNTELSPRTKYA